MDGVARLALTIQYLGARYAGWQAQENALAVQTVVERALCRLYRTGDRSVAAQGAARTDAGVHARMQVAHVSPPFVIPAEGILKGINTLLPADVRVVAVREVPEGFHALDSATEKEYRYRLRVGGPFPPLLSLVTGEGPARLDVEAMAAAAAPLAGRRDFALFRKSGSDVRTTVRDLREVSVEREAEEFAGSGGRGAVARAGVIRFTVRADGFLRGTVRLLVGTLVEVGRGRLPVAAPLALLSGDRSLGTPGPTMPASGLVLWRVGYPPESGGPEPPEGALW